MSPHWYTYGILPCTPHLCQLFLTQLQPYPLEADGELLYINTAGAIVIELAKQCFELACTYEVVRASVGQGGAGSRHLTTELRLL